MGMVASAVSVEADVFNMGGTISGGTWTGLASLSFVTVGNPGNVPDTAVMNNDGTTGYGSVPYVYEIGEYDVTAAQYTVFLNAVAATDTYGLYNVSMGTNVAGCGIARSGLSGSYTYSTTRNGNYPVNFVNWGDAARFCNWLDNGQPTGTERVGTTETGAYLMNGATSSTALTAVPLPSHSGAGAANFFLPSENEWYKAAYYDPMLNGGSGGYWKYATKSNTVPSSVLSATGTNNANFADANPPNFLTSVGFFADSPSPYGTFDQVGDVYQWNEAVVGSSRGVRCGLGRYPDLPFGLIRPQQLPVSII